MEEGTELEVVDSSPPHDFDLQIGYEGDHRYVGFWWKPHLNDLWITDGYFATEGRWRGFKRWDKETGEQLFEEFVHQSDDHDVEDISHTLPLTTVLEQSGKQMMRDPGFSDYSKQDGTDEDLYGFLLDRDTATIYVASRKHIKSFLKRFNETPEWVEQMPDDPSVVKELIQRVVDMDDEDPDMDLFD